MGWLNILGSIGLAGINYGMTRQINKENAALNQKYWDIQNEKTFGQNEQAADNAMKRSIDLYNTLQSPSSMVNQLKTAGLNPALMYSNGGMGGHTQSGPQGGAGSGQGAPTLGLQQFMDPLTFAQVENIKADTDKKKEETKNISKDTQVKETVRLLNNQSLTQNERRFLEEMIILQLQQENIQQDTETKLADKYLKDVLSEESKKRQAILDNEKAMSDIEIEFKRKFKEKGFDLDSMPGIASLIIQLGNKGKELLDKWLGSGWIIDWPEDLKFW